MTDVAILKPAKCQFQQMCRAPVLKSMHNIKREMMDEPAEAPTMLLFTHVHFVLFCLILS